MSPPPLTIVSSSLLALSLALLASSASAKICWEECSTSASRVVSADVSGCHRRPGRWGRPPLFRCDGVRGPPCFLLRGDRVTLNLTFETDFDFVSSTHEAFWVTPYGVLLPWAGMDTDACKYLSEPCLEQKSLDVVGGAKEKRLVTLRYPMEVLEMYPSGYFNLKWLVYTRAGREEGQSPRQVACFRFAIRIV